MRILILVLFLASWNAFAIPRYHYRPSLVHQEGYIRINQMKLLVHSCLGSDVYFITSTAEDDSPGRASVEVQDPRLLSEAKALSRLISMYGGTAYIKVIWVGTSIDMVNGKQIKMEIYRYIGAYQLTKGEKE